MSGICAVWVLDSYHERASRRVQAGLDAMAHRGGDGFSIYFDSNVALGHCLLETGCNGMFVDEEGFAISFDGRVDNREALLDSLAQHGFDVPHDAERLHDKELLLHLYRSFGEVLPAMLRGDFAIAIWDPWRTGLFLCRDHFGVRPLFWYRDEAAYYFASEIKALRAMAGGRPFPIRAAGAAEFMAGKSDEGTRQNTIYEGVFRLLPGHFARIDEDAFVDRRYWCLAPGLPVRRADNARQLRALLQQAINRRLRTNQSIGALLSGGIDSSSIVSLIGAGGTRRKLGDVAVFSLVFAGSEDESGYISAVEKAYDFAARRVDGSNVSAFDDCDAIIAEQDQPIAAPNISTFRHFLRTVAREGKVRVVLDGHGGDEAVSYGNGLFGELAESGRWWRLWRELGHCDEFRPKRGRMFLKLVRKRGLRAWRRAVGRLLWPGRRRGDPIRYSADGRPRPFEQVFHLAKLTTPVFAEALEVLDHNAAAAGIEVRMPFLDVDLIEFCVTVPAEEKWVRGTPRALIRTALADVLPPMIAARRDKFDFSDRIRNSVLARQEALVQQALDDTRGELGPHADVARLRASWQTLRESGTIDGERFYELWRSVMLHRWLHSRGAPHVGHQASRLSVPSP